MSSPRRSLAQRSCLVSARNGSATVSQRQGSLSRQRRSQRHRSSQCWSRAGCRAKGVRCEAWRSRWQGCSRPLQRASTSARRRWSGCGRRSRGSSLSAFCARRYRNLWQMSRSRVRVLGFILRADLQPLADLAHAAHWRRCSLQAPCCSHARSSVNYCCLHLNDGCKL